MDQRQTHAPFEPGTNVCVIVFCNLTHASPFAVTNLSALERAYGDKGVTVLAISPEDPELLKEYVQAHGADIDFSVAADTVPGATQTAYLQSFGQVMLPRAYVAQGRKVLWHGHPFD